MHTRQGGASVSMYAIERPESIDRRITKDWAPISPDPLRKTVGQGGTIFEVFQTIAYQREEQERVAADLLERETWAVTCLLIASAPIWARNTNLTLNFPLDQRNEPVAYRLELGLFSRLAGLSAPSAGELELLAATTPCWARVTPNLERHLAGYSDELACSYQPISMAEAVKLLGLDRIVDQIEAAARAARQSVMQEARAQEDRRARLRAVERLLGWESERDLNAALPLRTQLAMALLGKGTLASLPTCTIGVGVVAGTMYVADGLGAALIVFVLGMALLIAWGLYVVHTSRGG